MIRVAQSLPLNGQLINGVHVGGILLLVDFKFQQSARFFRGVIGLGRKVALPLVRLDCGQPCVVCKAIDRINDATFDLVRIARVARDLRDDGAGERSEA